MFRNASLAVLTMFGLAASAHASVIILTSSASSVPGLPGYVSLTITATSTVAGELIQGVDFAGDGSNDPTTGKGFFGAMNQLGPPLLNTTYEDNNSLIPLIYPGHTAAEDSQFLVNSGSANIGHPNGFDEESSTILQGIWAWADPQGQSVNFAQLVLPTANTAPLTFRGSFSLNTPHGIIDTPTITGGTSCLDCEPRFADATINNVDPNRPGFVDYIWPTPINGGTFSNLQFNSYIPAPGATGTGPTTPATLDPAQRKFHWDTVGSPLGTYKWFVTAFNSSGSSSGSITVNVTVPEPASLGWLAFASFAALFMGGLERSRV